MTNCRNGAKSCPIVRATPNHASPRYGRRLSSGVVIEFWIVRKAWHSAGVSLYECSLPTASAALSAHEAIECSLPIRLAHRILRPTSRFCISPAVFSGGAVRMRRFMSMIFR